MSPEEITNVVYMAEYFIWCVIYHVYISDKYNKISNKYKSKEKKAKVNI